MAFTQVTENSVTFKRSSAELAWILIYEGTDIILLDKLSGKTETQKSCYMSTDFNDIVNYIQTNGLNYNSLIIRDWDYFYTEVMKDISPPDTNGIEDLILAFHPDNWTLVHENGTVIALQQESIKISTSQTSFTSSNIEDCFDEILRLDLTWNDRTEYEELYPNYFDRLENE